MPKGDCLVVAQFDDIETGMGFFWWPFSAFDFQITYQSDLLRPL